MDVARSLRVYHRLIVPTLYKHTQVGWWILAVGVAIPLSLTVASWPPERSILLPAGLLLLPLAFFSTLTVAVSRDAIEASFGIGFLNRRIPVGQIRGWRIVRSPLYHGIGMRFIPGGMLYNVRSGPAVELLLDSDRILRIGTDEPQRLIEALAAVRQPPVPDYSSVVMTVRRGRWRRVAMFAIVVLPIALVFLMIQASEKPPRVTMSHEGMKIGAGIYGVELPWSTVTDVTLEQALPRVVRRTNGYALGGTLRGHFRVAGLGPARLFVERDEPPFVRITTSTQGVIYVGFGRGGGTRQLFGEISGVRRAASGG
jgi:hypothetical protein